MKRCPQCAFIYEDHQRICDMDGKELVQDSAPVTPEPEVSGPSRLTVMLPANLEVSPRKSRSKRLPVLVILFIVLATLLSVLFFAQVHRARSRHIVEPIQSERAAAPAPKAESLGADTVSSPAPTPLLEESPDSPQGSVQANLGALPRARAPLASSPVSAGTSIANSRSPSIVRLTNGANINADEVWERKEGIWYRQAGVVTLIKRNRVRTVEQLAPPSVPQKAAAKNGEEKSRKPNDRAAQKQLRIRQLEAIDTKVETKKPSRVSSFLKLTGRILKKPFKS